MPSQVWCMLLCGGSALRALCRVGGAAGTVAKSISAYDMSISDSMYGACARCARSLLSVTTC
jgi:hypothetical protein